jgi:hypothetical protein
MTKIIMTKYQLMCFLPALGKEHIDPAEFRHQLRILTKMRSRPNLLL